MWYRKKGSKKTLDPNMAPGLFLMMYRNVVRVMDYADFREKRNVNAIDVPEPELFIEEGPPVFPVANATHKSLVDGSKLESAARRALPDYPLREVPFPPDPGKATPPTPRDPRSRAVYITVERIIKFGETPGCKACLGKGTKHTVACCERFAKLLKEQREELAARTEVIAETPLPLMPSAPTTPAPPPAPLSPRPIIDPPYPHDAEARSSTDPAPHMAAARGAVGVTLKVGAAFAQCSSKCKCTSLAQSTKTSKALPVFGMPSQLNITTTPAKGTINALANS